MSVAITRMSITNDSGGGTDGTPIDASWMTTLYNEIDAILNATWDRVITVSGYGSHTFSASGNGANKIVIANTNSGAAAASGFGVSGDVANAQITVFSSGYPDGGWYKPNGAAFYHDGSGGLALVAAHASGDLRGYAGGTTQKFAVKASDGHTYTDNGSVYSLSDLRHKRLCSLFTKGLAELRKLTPAVYQHAPTSDMPTSEAPFVSLGAQDVRLLIPEAVSEDLDGRLGLGMGPLVYAAINAIKELDARLAACEATR